MPGRSSSSAISASSPSRPIRSSAGTGSAAGEHAGRALGLELGIVREDHGLEASQLGPGLDPQLVDELPAAVAHHLERLGLAAAAVEGDHQVPAQALAQRVLGHERAQLADEIGVAPGGQLGGDSLLDRLHPQLLEPADLRLRERLEAMVGERGPAPQRERCLEVVARGRRLVVGQRDAGAAQQVLEAMGVDRVGLDAERVAGRPAVERRRRPEPRAQARDLLLQGLYAVAGGVVGPQRLDQRVDPDGLGRAQRERSEQRALFGAIELDGSLRHLHVEGAQQLDFDSRAHPRQES